MHPLSLFGERSLTTVAAIYHDGHSAERVMQRLRRRADIGDVNVVSPNDPRTTAKLEPEEAGIWRTLLRSHVILGASGLILGLLAALMLVRTGWPAAAASPGMALLFLAVVGAFFGLIGGGLITLRPDRGWLIEQVREAAGQHRWTVVAHPLDRRGAARAHRLLRATGARTLRTF